MFKVFILAETPAPFREGAGIRRGYGVIVHDITSYYIIHCERKADRFVWTQGFLERKGGVCGYPFQLTHFIILAYPFQGHWPKLDLGCAEIRVIRGPPKDGMLDTYWYWYYYYYHYY